MDHPRTAQPMSWTSDGLPGDDKTTDTCIYCLQPGVVIAPNTCACSGANACVHLSCRVKAAIAKSSEVDCMDAWAICPTCKQPFSGVTRRRMAEEGLAHFLKIRDSLSRINWWGMLILNASVFEKEDSHTEALAFLKRVWDCRHHVGSDLTESEFRMFLLCVHKYSEILSSTQQFAAAEAVFSDVLDPDYPFASRLDERKAAIFWTSKAGFIALQGEHKRADLMLQDLLNECQQKFGVGDMVTLEVKLAYCVCSDLQGELIKAKEHAYEILHELRKKPHGEENFKLKVKIFLRAVLKKQNCWAELEALQRAL